MQPEKQILLDDVLNAPAGEARRAATLLAAATIMRRRKTFRFAARSLALLGVIALAGLAFHRKSATSQLARVQTGKPGPASSQNVQYLTDDQLLALFPNVPVGLITTADGKKRLIFLHPGDEAKYIIHL